MMCQDILLYAVNALEPYHEPNIIDLEERVPVTYDSFPHCRKSDRETLEMAVLLKRADNIFMSE